MKWAVIVVLVGACGHERILEVGDMEKPLDEARVAASYAWGNSSILSLSPTGSNVFPKPLSIRLRSYERCGHDEGDECEHDFRSASVKPVAGSSCTVTIPTACDGAACFTELSVDALGNCLLAVHAETTDGESDATCWHRAVYEADDPFDDALFSMYESRTDGERERCFDSL